MKLVDKIFKRNDWYVTSLFGYRDSINTSNGSTNNFHDGCDYGTHREKWPQYAIEDGEIIDCGTATDGAKYIWINYPRINKKILHYHLDSICVKTNQKVQEGSLLGYTGQSGLATGIHLHLGMQDSNGDTFQNPHSYNYIPQENNKTLPQQYMVKNGDNLSKIAEKYNTTWQELYELNKEVIGNNPNIIKPGQILKISSDKNTKQRKYIDQEGDNLSRIAEKYNTTWQKLYELNKEVIGNNPNIIKSGQILKI